MAKIFFCCVISHNTIIFHHRKWHLRKVKKCFVGSELVDWLLQDPQLDLSTREEAVDFGNMLLKR